MPLGVHSEVMRDRGVEVFHVEQLLTEALGQPRVMDWVSDHILGELKVGIAAADRAREWAQASDAELMTEFLIGGITRADVDQDVGLVWESAGPTSMLLPPLPNLLFQRDPSCWIFDGVTVNPMTKPARKPETMIMEAVYRFHPVFAAEKFPIWLGGTGRDWGRAHVEGGDVQPIGNGTVMFPQVVGGARTWSIRPGESPDNLVVEEQQGSLPELMAKTLGVGKMRVIETGGDSFEAEREQWDDGNNVVALEPGVVVAYERKHRHQHRAAQGRDRGDHHRGVRAGQGPRRRPLHDLPDRARPGVLRRPDPLPRPA